MQGPDGTVGVPLNLNELGITQDPQMQKMKDDLEKRIADAEKIPESLVALFTYHKPTPEQEASYKRIRETAMRLAKVIDECCPAGPDRTAAVRHIREAVMTANASIATNNAQYR